MIEKNEQSENDSTNNDHVNLTRENKKSLQDSCSKAKEDVKLCFEQLVKVLRAREQQLVRQIDAIHAQHLTIVQSNPDIPPADLSVEINLGERGCLEDWILKFGELSSSERDRINVKDAEPCKIEDYEAAERDHVTFEKYILGEPEDSRISQEAEIFEDSSSALCDSSFNTSSEATSENEITVLMNYDYKKSSDSPNDRISPKLYFSGRGDGFLNGREIGNEELPIGSPNSLETKGIARDVNGDEGDSIVPETVAENLFADEIDREKKKIVEKSRILAGKKISMSEGSESPVEIFQANSDTFVTRKKTRDSEKHPKQIQEWLEQILVETETEPTIHEIEQFAEISKSRFKEFQFILET